MAGCVLHVHGETLDPESFLARSTLDPYDVWQKGNVSRPGTKVERVLPHGGFKCLVSEEPDLAAQIREAIELLDQHHDDFTRLATHCAADPPCLSFGHFLRMGGQAVTQTDALPHALLKLCGELGIDIELCLYPTDDSNVRREAVE